MKKSVYIPSPRRRPKEKKAIADPEEEYYPLCNPEKGGCGDPAGHYKAVKNLHDFQVKMYKSWGIPTKLSYKAWIAQRIKEEHQNQDGKSKFPAKKCHLNPNSKFSPAEKKIE